MTAILYHSSAVTLCWRLKPPKVLVTHFAPRNVRGCKRHSRHSRVCVQEVYHRCISRRENFLAWNEKIQTAISKSEINAMIKIPEIRRKYRRANNERKYRQDIPVYAVRIFASYIWSHEKHCSFLTSVIFTLVLSKISIHNNFTADFRYTKKFPKILERYFWKLIKWFFQHAFQYSSRILH